MIIINRNPTQILPTKLLSSITPFYDNIDSFCKISMAIKVRRVVKIQLGISIKNIYLFQFKF